MCYTRPQSAVTRMEWPAITAAYLAPLRRRAQFTYRLE